MRKLRWAWAAVIALAIEGNAQAQNFQSALTGVNPANITFEKVNIKGAMVGTPALTNVGASGFSLTSFFRQMVGLGPTKVGRSTVPAPRYPNAYNPLPPINSTVNR